MEVGDRIRLKREEMGLTQKELALKVGYTTRAAISKIECDAGSTSIDRVIKIAEALRVTPGYLLGWEDEYGNLLEDAPANVLPVKKKSFPVLGEISCGQPIYAEEQHETYINASSDIDADFCLIANGDSMVDARINDGDVVFIKSTPIVDNGSIAAVVIGEETTLKRWYFYPKEKKLMLVPANSKYAPMVYVGKELNDVRCIGKAVCFMSNL